MKIYLMKDNELLREFDNVVSWSNNFVEYMLNGRRAKQYCTEDGEYFTDKYIEKGE